MPIKTLIVEDESDAVELITSIITEYCPELNIIGYAANVKNGIEQIELLKPELVLLDVALGNEKSFEILKHVKSVDFALVFTTAYSEYAFDAFQHDAIHYMLKPYSISEMKKMVQKVKDWRLKSFDNIEKTILINNVGQSLLIVVNEISHLEADRAYCIMHMNDGKMHIISKPLASMETEIELVSFVRCHNSFLVNRNSVVEMTTDYESKLRMKNGTMLPISRSRKDKLMEVFKFKIKN